MKVNKKSWMRQSLDLPLFSGGFPSDGGTVCPHRLYIKDRQTLHDVTVFSSDTFLNLTWRYSNVPTQL